jgi:hypothetical protein
LGEETAETDRKPSPLLNRKTPVGSTVEPDPRTVGAAQQTEGVRDLIMNRFT